MLEPGQTFASRYRVRRCIAEGGMGAIFEAEHLATERRVALKLLFPHIMSVANARQKFELEAKISARVNSPYIVEVLDAGFDEASKSPFLVMELLAGQTLAARVREQGPLGVDEALRLLEQVAAGLDAAHGYKEPGGAPKPIVHRDLKPENLFLARQHDGTIIAKILDYGIAKVLGDTTHISQEVRGTPLFMAFEQITAGALSPQSDVWALGLIGFHALTGARYWRSAERQGASVQSLFAEILTLPLEAPSTRLREQGSTVALPPAFDAWLLRCIDRDPSQRFASAGAAIEALGRVFERAPRGSASQPSLQPLQPGNNTTQTFIAADMAARAAAAAAASRPSAAPAVAHGSVPALSATGYRRALSARLMGSPLHWAAIGAVTGVALLGGIIWLATGDPAPTTEPPTPGAAAPAEPSSTVQASRPAPEAAAPSPSRATPSEPPADDSRGSQPAAPRIRIAPLDETPPAAASGGPLATSPGSSAAAATAQAASRAGAPPSPPVSGAGASSGARAGGEAGAAPAIGGDAVQRASASGAAARPERSEPAASPNGAHKPSPNPAKRPRKPVGTGEAYSTR